MLVQCASYRSQRGDRVERVQYRWYLTYQPQIVQWTFFKSTERTVRTRDRASLMYPLSKPSKAVDNGIYCDS